MTETRQIIAELRRWRLEEPNPKELAQSFYGGVVALSSQGRLVEYGNAFADVLRSFRSNGRGAPSLELEEMVRRATLAKVGEDLLLWDDVQKLMAQWMRIVELPRYGR